MFLFLKRIRHCAGFGIQSPTDYAFVREVVYQRTPFYAYEELASQFPSASKKLMWQARLLHRVANHAQADIFVCCGGNVPIIYSEAIRKGCKNTNVIQLDNYEELVQTLADGTWFVIPDIYKENKELWERVKKLDNVVSFDLYHLAIAFMDRKRYSEVHIVNPY